MPCTHCDADTLDHSDLCEVHHAQLVDLGEHAARCICWGCAKYFARNTGLMHRYRECAKAHPVTVALCLRLPRIAAGIAAGAILTVVDVAALDEQADANRTAWIAGLEADAEASEADALAGALDARGYARTAESLRAATGAHRVGALRAVREALPAIVRAAGCSL